MSRKLLLILLVPAVLLLAGYLYLRFSLQQSIKKEEEQTGFTTSNHDTLGGRKTDVADLRPLFIKRLELVLKKSSGGLYNLSVNDLIVDVLSGGVSLQGVKMTPDANVLDSLTKSKALPANVFDVSFDSLVIQGISLDDAITSKTMDYDLVKLVHPTINIHRKAKGEKKENKEGFQERFLKEMEKLSIKKLVVEGGNITVYNDMKKTPPNNIKNVSVELNDVLLDSVTREDKDRFLFAKSSTISFGNYSRPTPDGLYMMKAEKLTVTTPEDNVTINNFSFTSPLSKTEFSRRQKQSKELYNVSIPSIQLKGVDWWSAFNEDEFLAQELVTTGGNLSIYLDRSLPPKSKMGNFPNQLLLKLPVRLQLAKARVQNLDFTYSEYSPVSQKTGTVKMAKVNLTMSNLSNSTKQPMVVNGEASFMNQVPIKAKFVFNMARAKAGAFTADVSAKGFDGKLINSFTEPMGLMRIERGNLQGLEASIKGDQSKASGQVYVPYQDLKIALMEKEDGKKTLDKKNVTSFLANLLVIKNDNPKKGNAPRKEMGSFTRIPEGGFFMLVWKTILVGVLKTIGAPIKLAYKTASVQQKK